MMASIQAYRWLNRTEPLLVLLVTPVLFLLRQLKICAVKKRILSVPEPVCVCECVCLPQPHYTSWFREVADNYST